MADDVIITGLSGIEMWATEKSVQSLINEISSFKSQTQAQKDQIIKSIIDGVSSLNSAMNNSGATGGGTSDLVATNLVNAINNLNNSIGNIKNNTYSNVPNIASGYTYQNNMPTQSGIGGAVPGARLINDEYASISAKASAFIYNSSRSFASAIGITLPPLNELRKTLFLLPIAAVAGLTKVLVDQGAMYRDLYKNAILYMNSNDDSASSMGKFVSAALKAQMTMTDLSTIMQKYSRVVNREGLDSFATMVAHFKETGYVFGYTTQESAEYLAEYMDQLRNSGALHLMTQQQIMIGAQKQMQQTNELSRAMGITTKEFEEQRKNIASSEGYQSALLSLPEELRRKAGPAMQSVGAALGELGGPFQTLILKAIQSPTLMMGDELAKAAMAMGDQEFIYGVQRFAENIRNGGEVTQESIMSLMGSIGNMGKNLQGNDVLMAGLQKYGYNVNQYAGGILKASEIHANYNKNASKEQDGYIKAMSALSSSVTFIKNIFNQVIGGLWGNKQFVDQITKMMNNLRDTLTGSVPEMTEGLSNLILKVGHFATELLPKIIDAFSKLADFIGNYLTPMLESEGEKLGNDTRSFGEKLIAYGAATVVGLVGLNVGMSMAANALFNVARTGVSIGPMWASIAGWGGKLAESFKLIFTGTDVMAKSGGILSTIGGILKPFTSFTKFLGPITILFDGFLGLLRGITEFNPDNIGGSIVNIFLRISQGVAEGLMKPIELLVAAIYYAYKKIISFGADDITFSDALKSTSFLSNALAGKFDETSNILTGNKNNTPSAIENQQEIGQIRSETNNTTNNNNQKEIIKAEKESKETKEKETATRTEFYEKSTQINKELVSILEDIRSLARNTDTNQQDILTQLRKMNTQLGNVYNKAQ